MGVADLAGWVALVATCLAALMTASNLGSRVTGWGFVIFSIGAGAWILVGLKTGQAQLAYSNIFLALVDVLGIWRWLGQRAHHDDVVKSEETRSQQSPGSALFSVVGIADLPVLTVNGDVAGHTVDALAGCTPGKIEYLIVRTGGMGGVGETLRRLPWEQAQIADQHVRTSLDLAAIERLPQAAG